MVRLFAASADPDGCTVRLSPEDFHHLAHARRAVPGEAVGVVCGNTVREGTIAALYRSDGTLVMNDVRCRPARHPSPRLEIIQTVPEERRVTDDIVRMLTPLAPETITLVDAAPLPGEKQLTRWREIVRAEALQSRLDFLPVVRLATTVAVQHESFTGTTIILDPSGDEGWHTAGNGTGEVRLVAGAERGFTAAELSDWRAAGGTVRRLDTGILRARLAAFAATVLIRNRS